MPQSSDVPATAQPPTAPAVLSHRAEGAGELPPRTRPQGRERWVLAILLTASFTLAVDFSILNVALPLIGADVGLALQHWQWIGTSYALCAAGFTLAFGRLADLLGRRRVFLTGMTLLALASTAGAVAEGPTLLLLARVGQGLATAMVIPSGLSMLTTEFPEGPLRQRALGLNGALMAAGFTTGAVLGGILTGLLSWRWAFLLNVVVGVAVLVIAPIVLKESKPARRPTVDVAGALTVTGALVSIVYAMTRAGETSWADKQVLGAGAATVLLVIAFALVEQRATQPLIPLSLIRRPALASANAAGVLAFATETSLVFLLTVHMQETLGWSPVSTGLAFALLGAGTVIGGILGPRIIGAIGAKHALVAALTVQGFVTAPLALLTDSTGSIVLMLLATFIGGVANLVAIVGFMVQGTAGVPNEEQGAATGLATLSQQIGIALGTPVMSSIVAATSSGAVGASEGLGHAVSVAIACNSLLCLATAAMVIVTQRHQVAA